MNKRKLKKFAKKKGLPIPFSMLIKQKKKKMLSGGQAKLDKNKNNRIDAQDFKILRAEKAKGRGQGLQDEKMKPGKVKPVKAVLGIATMGLMGAKYLKDRKKKAAMVPGIGAAGAIEKKKKEILGKKKGGMFKGYSKVFETAAKAGQKNTGTSTIVGVQPKLPEASKKSKIARRALRAAKATRLGKMVLPIAAAGVAAQQYLKSKMKKNKKENKPKVDTNTFRGGDKTKIKPMKKMGGGMMQRTGYSVGGSVTVKTKLGRNRPTKIY